MADEIKRVVPPSQMPWQGAVPMGGEPEDWEKVREADREKTKAAEAEAAKAEEHHSAAHHPRAAHKPASRK